MLYTLNAGPARATFDPKHGGRLTSLCVFGLELLVGPEDDPMAYGCYPMTPWAGRVRDGRFAWQGQDYQLPINHPPHAIHGTVFQRQWEVEGQSLRIDLGPDWPWAGKAISRVQLAPDELVWSIEVHAQDAEMPAVIGWHPWFRRQLARGAPLDLSFEAQGMMRRDAAGIATQDIVGVPRGPWDDCFVGVSEPVRLSWGNALSLSVESDCLYWVIYDEPDHALCVEPQSGPPDAFNLDLASTVKPGTPMIRTMKIRWELG